MAFRPTHAARAAAPNPAKTRAGASSPRLAYTAPLTAQDQGDAANGSRESRARSRPANGAPSPEHQEGHEAHQEPQGDSHEQRAVVGRAVARQCLQEEGGRLGGRKHQHEREKAAEKDDGQSGQRAGEGHAEREHHGELGQGRGLHEVGEERRREQGTEGHGEPRRRVRSWVSVRARPVRRGESAQRSPTRVAAAERPGSRKAGSVRARALTPK